MSGRKSGSPLVGGLKLSTMGYKRKYENEVDLL